MEFRYFSIMQNLILFIFLLGCSSTTQTNSTANTSRIITLQMSQNFLISLQNDEPTSAYLDTLATLNIDDLAESLTTKEEKLAFWINLYNALVQHRLVDDITQFDDRDAFFTEPFVDIGGVMMSFDDIEHGIIRNSRVKLGLGYLKHWFVSDWEKKLRNTDIDGRVHFALNCGAKSCPPVGIYEAERFNEQIDKSATMYLRTVTSLEGEKIKTSPLFSWFRGDFGGKSGTKKMLESLRIITQNQTKYSLEYGDYDWTADIGNYVEL